MSYLALGFFISGLVLFIAFILFSRFNYKKRFNNDYHFLNFYPYELNYEGKFKDNLYGNISFILFIICYLGFYAFFDTKYSNGFYVFTLIAGIVNLISLVAVVFVPLKNIKAHLGFTVLLFTFSFLLPAGIGIDLIKKYYELNNAGQLTVGIISLVFAAFVFLLMFNPKLSRWAKVDVVDNEDGTKSYIRPKYFPLAYTEWLLIFTNCLLPILAIISTTLS